MAGLLGDIFSTVDTTKRKLTDLLGNPVLSAQQIIGNMNDRARVLNQLTAGAAQERELYGPKSQQLANMIADAYNPMGMIVYHGSPAKFSRFDPTKIGSGEGAQSYGYGHYVAQSPTVAKEYQTALSNKAGEVLIDGKKLKPKNYEVTQTIARYSDDKKALQLNLSKYIKESKDNPYADIESAQLALDALKTGKNVSPASSGYFYEIDLPDEQIARMLNWDKPLKDQPEALKAIRNQIQDAEIERSFDANVKSGISGANAMQNYVWGKTQADKSEALRQAGIPGIRYLDQGSRGADQGTSNFVVFPGNEDLLRILKRNEDPLGLLAP